MIEGGLKHPVGNAIGRGPGGVLESVLNQVSDRIDRRLRERGWGEHHQTQRGEAWQDAFQTRPPVCFSEPLSIRHRREKQPATINL